MRLESNSAFKLTKLAMQFKTIAVTGWIGMLLQRRLLMPS